ncbi:hypothetical protein BX616_008338 [Lobosporangium transversale]|uniref:UBX domain-containing protein 2 n=1 Tax=Lobosporangium transversale TaxID=64571 RepID=A0A1Y2GWU4_9FUNG|nr:hypothetical protein BCR41DRAFT_393346 [Lobosporangium transversale]KAF9919320.1 hypothetical protein BX616_008338 [Lobosporangium transversale]ORZ26739.1 hypothetical protein BCR41DRAFT_393346 [Lobosporangium transversale]|eukprot:XP_021884502.1 hypothetical protein BCR41DRAFT_393346 [Lobosporangium transversale]
MLDSQDTDVSINPWFEGSVAAAVDTAKTKDSVLLVCLVQDSNEESESYQFERRFSDTKVVSELSNMNVISLRLIKDSPDGLMFGQIFPIMVVPALYLIRNGLLTDFINNAVDIDQMLERIKKAVDGHFQIPPPPGTTATPASTSMANISTSSSPDLVTQVPEPSTTTLQPNESNDFVSVSVSAPSASLTAVTPTMSIPTTTSTAIVSPSPSSIVEGSHSRFGQAQELKELMKERKLKREKEELEAAKQREKDRRSSSKALSEAQRELAEKQSKKIKDQMEKDKREEAEYKRRVKQALEEDKARRKAEKEKAQAAVVTTAALGSSTEQEVLTPADIHAQNSSLTQARNDAAPALAYDTSRLNIRLFDGSSVRHTFKATDTLEQVREWINQNQEEDEDTYNIVQLIPPRTFTDESRMLRDLELCPSATLVLRKTTKSSSAYRGTGDGGIPTVLGYGWSALSLVGKVASSAYSTVSYYNPLASSGNEGSNSAGRPSDMTRDSRSDSYKKKDREVSYNGNSTNLE